MSDALIELSHCLQDVELPQSRVGLLTHARERGASAAALHLLHQFPDWQYATRQQLMQAFSEVRLRE